MEMTKDLTISLPEGYASITQSYALLLSLDPVLPAAEIATRLREEGLMPPLIVAVRAEGSNADAASLLERLTVSHRILEAPQARWICGAGHSAAEALRFVLDHPDLAGRAASLSTSFEGAEGAPPLHSRLLRELEERVDFPAGVKLFLDYGTIGLDECYEPYHRDLAALFRSRKWKEERDFEIRRIVGGSHDAASWTKRLGPALRWLATR